MNLIQTIFVRESTAISRFLSLPSLFVPIYAIYRIYESVHIYGAPAFPPLTHFKLEVERFFFVLCLMIGRVLGYTAAAGICAIYRIYGSMRVCTYIRCSSISTSHSHLGWKIFFCYTIYLIDPIDCNDWSSFRIHSCCRCNGIFCFVRNVYRVRLVFFFHFSYRASLERVSAKERRVLLWIGYRICLFKFEYIYLVEL